MSNKENQSHFSVEDMVDAAHDKASRDRNPEQKKETREVIVQEDGTKVVRVRRKKRKSSTNDELLSTAEDEKKSYVKLLLISLAAFATIAIILLGIFFFKIAYYNNPDFITNLENAFSKKLHSNVQLNGFRLGPTNSIIRKVTITSNTNEYPFFKGEISKLSFSHKPETVIFGGISGGDSHGQSANFIFDYDEPVEVKKINVRQDDFSIPFGHKSLGISEANISFSSARNAPQIKDVGLRFLIRSDDKMQVFLKSGRVENFPNLPSTLESAIIVNDGEELDIKSIKLSNGSVGIIDINGEYSKLTRLPQTLNADFKNMRLETLHKNLSEIMEARVNSEKGTLEISPEAKVFALNADLQMANVGFSLKNFKFLEDIGEKLGALSYSYVRFLDSTDVSIKIDKEGYTFSNIDFEKKGNLSLLGEFHISNDGTLNGQLKVGLPTSKILREYPEVQRESLTTNKGYSWFDVTLFGNTQEPRDDFSQKFDAVVDALN